MESFIASDTPAAHVCEMVTVNVVLIVYTCHRCDEFCQQPAVNAGAELQDVHERSCHMSYVIVCLLDVGLIEDRSRGPDLLCIPFSRSVHVMCSTHGMCSTCFAALFKRGKHAESAVKDLHLQTHIFPCACKPVYIHYAITRDVVVRCSAAASECLLGSSRLIQMCLSVHIEQSAPFFPFSIARMLLCKPLLG
jgi:hypothetical protein